MKTKSFKLTMSDGFEICLNRWEPDNSEDVKAVIQLHHGLQEHSMRYDRLGSILAENGYVLNAYDMRGHGKTAENSMANNSGIFGKLADKDGFNRVVDDLFEISLNTKKEYPGKPFVVFGHSFGSFVTQGVIEKYGDEFDACILCGTSGPKPKFILNGGKAVVALTSLFRGKNANVALLSKISFSGYNKKVENKKTSIDWLSANEFNIQMYQDDKWCGTPLTVSFFRDMMNGLKQIHKIKNINKIPNSLPVLFIYGEDDPVGDYGKSIKKLEELYRQKGMSKVNVKSYAGDRHEILNEMDKETVENDILDWLSKTINK